MKQLFVKKTSQPNRPSHNGGRPAPRDILPPNRVRTQTRLQSIHTTGKDKPAGLTGQTDTQTAILMQVVERWDCQQEELNFLKDFPSLPQDRQRSRSPRQRSQQRRSPNSVPHNRAQTWNGGYSMGPQAQRGRNRFWGRQNWYGHGRDQSQQWDLTHRDPSETGSLKMLQQPILRSSFCTYFWQLLRFGCSSYITYWCVTCCHIRLCWIRL